MTSFAAQVDAIVRECLYPEEITGIPADAVVVKGIMRDFAFDPKAVAVQKPKIAALIDQIVADPFYADKGGGMSFLNLCMTKDDDHWAEHPTMEVFYVLSAAIGRAKFCMPQDMWPMLPGGMPYIQFTRA
jgi:hypothetical protein